MRYISSFSGIGLRVLTAKKTETIGEYTGTIWFTFLLLPIFPIKRLKIRVRAVKPAMTNKIPLTPFVKGGKSPL